MWFFFANPGGRARLQETRAICLGTEVRLFSSSSETLFKLSIYILPLAKAQLKMNMNLVGI